MGRIIHVGNGTDGYAAVGITDAAADTLLGVGVLYECGDDPGDHDLHIDPDTTHIGMGSLETLLIGIAAKQPSMGGGEIIAATIDRPETRSDAVVWEERGPVTTPHLYAEKPATGLPVAGYKPTQPQEAIDLVNENKEIEERCLRQIEKAFARMPDVIRERRCDLHPADMFVEARSRITEAFMWLNRGIFLPGRVKLPEDKA